MISQDQGEIVDEFTPFGVYAFTTSRQVGSFSTGSDEPVREVMARWDMVRRVASAHGVRRLATAAQVHGAKVIVHAPGWTGWLRGLDADGHVSAQRGTALAVTLADCVPVFIAHPSGAVALLHSGWRGTAARIVEQGIAALAHRGFPEGELRLHLGPAICGKCYEVSSDVIKQLTGETVSAPRTVDLRALIADHARAMGVRHITISPSCTKHDNARFFSHRAGDRGRQVGVIFASRDVS
jgi:YfiH family protein